MHSISNYLLNISNCITSLTYTEKVFNNDLFINNIIDKYDIKNLLVTKKENDLSKEFIKFIIESDILILKKYRILEQNCNLWLDKLQLSNEKLSNCYFNEFFANSVPLNKHLNKFKELSDTLKNDISIYNTLRDNNMKLIAEIDENKKNANDANIRTVLLSKLKKSEELSNKYANDITNTNNSIKELQKVIDELDSKRTNASVKYCKIKSDIQFFSSKIHDIMVAMDKFYDVDISNFLAKHKIIITDYIIMNKFIELLKNTITDLKKVSDSYDLGLQLNVIQNCFLNCSYSETITSNGTHYMSTKGIELYTHKKFQPSLKLRIKSFKLLFHTSEYIKAVKDNMDDISIYISDAKSTDISIQAKAMSKILPKLYTIAVSIFNILYGDYGLIRDKPIYKGLYERGVTSSRVYLHEYPSNLYKYSKKEIDETVCSKIYHTIISELYKLSVVNMALDYDFKVGDIVINKLKFLSNGMESPESYNRYLHSHQKINEKK